MRNMLAWLLLCASAVASEVHNITRRETGSGAGRRVVCYYTNWSVYRPGTAKFSPQNINPYLCTHLIYAFGGLTRENSLRPYDKYQDIEQGGYAKFTGLKTYNKNLKTLLAIGGWNEGSARFSPLVADEERRAEFVHNVVKFLRQNHFDGLDLDWEYPAFRDGGKPRDRENYALLVQELRAEFDRESSKTGRSRLLLTMAVPAGIEYIDKGYDIPKLNRYLDFMNILSYDYHSAFEPAVNHHAPLYPLEEDSEYNFDAQLSIDYTIGHYLKLGADRDKLVLGIPTYGRSYTLYNPLATEIGSPADGPGEQGDATREKGYLAYYEICENIKSSDGWKVVQPNPTAMGPYAYKGNQWVGYDDIDIVKLKARYVSENGLGGVMFWAIDNDDFRGKCHGRPYPLIEAGKEALLATSGSSNEVVSIPPSSGGGKSKRPGKRGPSNSGGRQTSSQGRKRRPSRLKSSSTTSTTTTTTTTPKYDYGLTTPEPPTTPDPGSDFMCKDEGFFPHPRDCKKYFWCLDSGPSNLGIVAHQFTCPSGLFFNKAADSCDYARNVVCKKKPSSGTTTKAPPITAATSRTTRLSTTSTTTTTTTTTPEPEPEEEYDEEYEDEEEAEEDPQVIKELINLIKKLGGVEQLEKQLHLQETGRASGDTGSTPAISKTLYERVLSRNKDRASTTPKYTSLFRNRPVGPQNAGLDSLEEVQALRREKPKYVTISRNRPSTPAPEEELEDDEEVLGEDELEDEDAPGPVEEDVREQHSKLPEYVTIRRQRPSTTTEEVTTPKYVTIQRSRPKASTEAPEPVEEEITTTTTTERPRPVYFSTSSTPKLRPVTPSRPTRAPPKVQEDVEEEEEEATTEQVSLRYRPATEEAPTFSGNRPAYVDITSIGRRRGTTTPAPEYEENLVVTTESPTEVYSKYKNVDVLTRRRGSTLPTYPTTASSASPVEQEPTTPLPTELARTTTPSTRRRGSTLPTYRTTESSASPVEQEPTTPLPTELARTTLSTRRRGSTLPTYRTTESSASPVEQEPTTPLPTEPARTTPSTRRRGSTLPTYPTRESSVSPVEQEPTTPLPTEPALTTPSTTRFTPTVTRVITSVTESGTTERQRIAVNRVPYLAIAAARGETVYPGPFFTLATTPIVRQSTEKVMEINRITLVTAKEEATERMTTHLDVVQIGMDKVSEVNRMKQVTVVSGVTNTTEQNIPLTEPTVDTTRPLQELPSTTLRKQTTSDADNEIETTGYYQPQETTGLPNYFEATNDTYIQKQPELTAIESLEVQTEPDVSYRRWPTTTPDPYTRRVLRPVIITTTKAPPAVRNYTSFAAKTQQTGLRRRPFRGPTRSTSETPPEGTDIASKAENSTISNENVTRGQRRKYRPFRSSTTEGPAETPRTFSAKRRGNYRRRTTATPAISPPSVEEVTLGVTDVRDIDELLTTIPNSLESRSRFVPNSRRKNIPPKEITSSEATQPPASTGNVVSSDSKQINEEIFETTTVMTEGEDPEKQQIHSENEVTLPLTTSTTLNYQTPPLDEVTSTSTATEKYQTTPIVEVTESDHTEAYVETSPDVNAISAEQKTEAPISSTRQEYRTTPLIQTSNATTEKLQIPPVIEVTSTRTRGRIRQRYRTTPLARTSLRTTDSTADEVETRPLVEVTSPLPSINRRPQKYRTASSLVQSSLPATSATPEELGPLVEVTSPSTINRTRQKYRTTSLVQTSLPTTTPTVEELQTQPLLEVTSPLNVSATDQKYSTTPLTSTAEPLTSPKGRRRLIKKRRRRPTSSDIANQDNEVSPAHEESSNLSVTPFVTAALLEREDSTVRPDSDVNEPYPPSSLEEQELTKAEESGYDRNFLQLSAESPSQKVSHEKEYMSATVMFPDGSSKGSVIASFSSDGEYTLDIASIDVTTTEVSEAAEIATQRSPSSRRRRPLKEDVGEVTTTAPITTTARSPLRRPSSVTLYNRARQRGNTSYSSTTTSTTETPSSSTAGRRRRPGTTRVVRRRKYNNGTIVGQDSDATASQVQALDSNTSGSPPGGRVRKYSFPKRRTSTTPSPTTTTIGTTAPPPPPPPPPPVDEKELLESNEQQISELEDLPDLADPAVVAIHNLATAAVTTVSPVSSTLRRREPVEYIGSTVEQPVLISSTGAPYVVSSTEAPIEAVSKIRLPSSSTSRLISTTSAPRRSNGGARRLPSAPRAPRPFSRVSTSASTTSRPRPRPQPVAPIVDYDYYDDVDSGADAVVGILPASAGKVKIHSDGYIECLDRGNFPHPFSCKKFISCAKMENGELLGWEYTCPRQLSFDPIGGICNWSAGLGCKE